MFVFASTQSASAAVLDFEGFDPGRIIDDQHAPDLTINAINLRLGRDIARIFDTADLNPAGQDIHLVGPFDSLNSTSPDELNPGNVLIIHARHDCDLELEENKCDPNSRVHLSDAPGDEIMGST